MRSLEIAARVCTKATSVKSTGAKNASNDGDLRLRSDENIAAVAISKKKRNCIIKKLKNKKGTTRLFVVPNIANLVMEIRKDSNNI